MSRVGKAGTFLPLTLAMTERENRPSQSKTIPTQGGHARARPLRFGSRIFLERCAVLTNIVDGEGLECRKVLDAQHEVSTMNDRIDESNDYPIVGSRANLFYLLQTLAKETQARAVAFKDSKPSITNEQLPAYTSNNGMM